MDRSERQVSTAPWQPGQVNLSLRASVRACMHLCLIACRAVRCRAGVWAEPVDGPDPIAREGESWSLAFALCHARASPLGTAASVPRERRRGGCLVVPEAALSAMAATHCDHHGRPRRGPRLEAHGGE